MAEESNDLGNGRPNCLSKLGYKYMNNVLDQKTRYLTLLWESRQYIRTCPTNIQHTIAKKGKYLGNVSLNRLSKLGYEYFNKAQVGNFDNLPCSESTASASAPASQEPDFPDPRRVMICGMADLIDSRNSATNSSVLVHQQYSN